MLTALRRAIRRLLAARRLGRPELIAWHPRTVWQRLRRRQAANVVALHDVRRRLEILLTALYGRPFVIEPIPRPPRRGLLRRLMPGPPRWLRPRERLAAAEGERIRLPEALEAADGGAGALARYRLLAVEQAERLTRDTAAHAPASGSRLVRDLYHVHESAAIDHAIATRLPGLRAALVAERRGAIAQRRLPHRLHPAERLVESLVCDALARDTRELAPAATPAESVARARAIADRLGPAARYRGVPPVSHWGLPPTLDTRPPDYLDPLTAGDPLPSDGGTQGQGDADPNADEQGARTPQPRPDDANRAGGEEEGSDAPLEDQAYSRENARAVATADAAVDPFAPAAPGETVTLYPEWDFRRGRHEPRGVAVRERAPAEGDPSWATAELARDAVLLRRVRERFERLRARRVRLGRQREGDELDLSAVVRALVDARAGQVPDDRLYVAVHPARRGLAIALLADASGSTETRVNDTQRVIDVERTALLVASEAFDALGDLYSIMSFTGKGAAAVRLTTIKDFAEANGTAVRSRIAALEPAGFTRLGAAIRHATARLSRQPAGHRLLLILSDGVPHDMDHYVDQYAIEDSRQAIAEARARGVYPFCLTIDRQGSEYLSHIFGPAGHTILRHPEQLPTALLGVVRHLLRS